MLQGHRSGRGELSQLAIGREYTGPLPGPHNPVAEVVATYGALENNLSEQRDLHSLQPLNITDIRNTCSIFMRQPQAT